MKPIDYWQLEANHSDQQFYVAFSILASACSDYAVGADLRLGAKLNWACTALYYSLVHAARLSCFVEAGDFPTGHKELGDLFVNGRLTVRRSWVERRLLPLDHRIEPIDEFCLSGLSPQDRSQWGEILTQARKLRDDANYEGLLISNEYSHERVTACFAQLAKTLQMISELQVPKSIQAFKRFVDESPRRDYWHAFLNWKSGHTSMWRVSGTVPVGEGLYYLHAALAHRGASKQAIEEVLDWLHDLRGRPDSNTRLAEEVHSNIVRSAFALKSRLFDEFRTKVDGLSESIGAR